MNLYFSKLSPLCQGHFLAGLSLLLSSCQLPKAKPDAYSVAEWSVHSTVSKEDYPVGVSLEHVDEAVMPSSAQIAMGLPDYQGTGQAQEPTVANEALPEPHLAAQDAQLPITDELLSVDANLPPPTVAQTTMLAALPEIQVATEVRKAQVHPTPENLALMAAYITRPPKSSRGVNTATTIPETVALAAPPADGSSDLNEIRTLARQLEATHR